MATIDTEIVVEIKSYIDQHGGDYPLWYVGLAEYPEEQLAYHGVNLDRNDYICLTAPSLEDAKTIKEFLIARFGLDGDPLDTNDPRALNVYTYRKSASTEP